jgi:hypothetical protein
MRYGKEKASHFRDFAPDIKKSGQTLVRTDKKRQT